MNSTYNKMAKTVHSVSRPPKISVDDSTKYVYLTLNNHYSDISNGPWHS